MSRDQVTSAVLIVLTLLGSTLVIRAESTPPIMPTVVETALPPAITLPAPEAIPPDVPNAPLTASEAASIALLHQPTMTVARMGVLAAQGRRAQAKAGLLPTLAVTGGYTDQMIAPSGNGGSSDPFTAGMTVRQLVFDYNRTREQARQAAAQERSATANLSRAQSDLVLQVKQAYYGFVQNQRLVSVNEANLQNRRQHLAQAQARLTAGVGLPVDVVRAETAVADAILSLNLAQNAASIAQVNLAQLMGLDPRTPIRTAEEGEPAQQTEEFAALQAVALQRRPEISQAQANLDAAQSGITIAKVNNAPSLVGTVGMGLRGSSFPPSDDSLTLGLAMQWAAFDAGLTRGRVTEAQANYATAQAQLTTARLAVLTDLSQAYLNEKTAIQRLSTATAQVTNAQEALRLVEGRYNAGLGIFLDVLDAQAALVTAQTNRVNAQSAVNQARAALAHALNNDGVLAK